MLHFYQMWVSYSANSWSIITSLIERNSELNKTINNRIGGTDGCFPKACSNGMCSMAKERFSLKILCNYKKIHRTLCLAWDGTILQWVLLGLLHRRKWPSELDLSLYYHKNRISPKYHQKDTFFQNMSDKKFAYHYYLSDPKSYSWSTHLILIDCR